MSDQLANVFDEAAIGMAVVGLDGRFVRVNPALCRLLRRSEAELLSDSLGALSLPEDAGRENEAVARLLAGDLERHETTRVLRAGDGGAVDTDVTASLLKDAEDRPTGFFVQLRARPEPPSSSEERLRLLIEGATDVLSYRIRFLPEPACEYITAGVERILGFPPQAFYDDPDLWRKLAHPDDLEALAGMTDVTIPTVVRWRRADGSYAWLEHRRMPILDDEGQRIGLDGIAHDVSERKVALEALTTSERRFRSLVQNVSDLIVTVDREGHLGYVSPSVERVLGFQPGELERGRPEFIHPEDLPALRGAFERAGDPGGMTTARVTCRTQHRDGSWLWLEYQIVNLVGDPSVDGYVVVARDVTERKEAEEQLIHQALHDALTGLPNRALFLDRLGLALSRLERRDGLAAVFFLDLDHFKVVNDSLGHTAGDQVLIALAERLQRSLRDGDTAARLGGDEFAVLCEDLVDDGEAVQIAERLGAAVSSEPVRLSGRDLVLTASIGVAFADSPRHRPDALLRDADAAMYRAKERGRARYELFDAAMRHRALTRLETEAALRRALEQGDLALVYQPEVQLTDGTLVGAEALLRWPVGTTATEPADFIPVAEETGLIIPIGAWVLREACRHLEGWRKLAPDRAPGTISLNLSGRQLLSADLPDVVAHALAEFDVDPGSLRIEITESALMDDVERAVGALKTLKALGIVVAIDDFGTGYSSLAHLRRFPVDVLKIDDSFIAGLGRNPEDAAIVRTILGLARTLELEVVAEGVERTDQLEELRALGCDRAQGNLFSPPLPQDEFAALLTKS